MSVLPIVIYGSSILRKNTKPIKRGSTEELKPLIADMFETMKQARGVGLAAPQIGKSIRLIIADISKLESYEDVKPIVAINPQILEYAASHDVYEEGCLSIPFLTADVKRPTSILLKYRDENFEPQIATFDNFVARVLQHEIDHLNGILFIDKISKDALKAIKPKLDLLAEGKADHIPYPTRHYYENIHAKRRTPSNASSHVNEAS